jgi:hypothetical protein
MMNAVMAGLPGAAQDRLPAACRVPGLAVLVFRGGRANDAGLLVLRHENTVPRRHAGPVPLEYSIERPTCAITSGLDAVMVG